MLITRSKTVRTVLAGMLCLIGQAAVAADHVLPDPASDVSRLRATRRAVFAGGCFWCTEAVFEQLAGVKKVISGYAGGTGNPPIQTVSAGKTDHAESIQITFDPAKISYGQLLKVFFEALLTIQLSSTGRDPIMDVSTGLRFFTPMPTKSA